MTLHINWKAGILSAIAFAIIGTAFFIFVGSNVDFACKNTTPHALSCRAYNAINIVIQGYTDIWRSIFAPRCLGGNGPDDCLGPDGAIMLGTLLVIGFVVGNCIWRKRP